MKISPPYVTTRGDISISIKVTFLFLVDTNQFNNLSDEAAKYNMSLGELIRYKLGFESKSNTDI